MDFKDTPEEAAFRAEVRAWIDANAPKHLEPELKQAGFASSGLVSEDPIEAGKKWQKKEWRTAFRRRSWGTPPWSRQLRP